MPNYVDHFKCTDCHEWVYADDARICAARLSRHPQANCFGVCLHHLPKAKIRCDHCNPR